LTFSSLKLFPTSLRTRTTQDSWNQHSRPHSTSRSHHRENSRRPQPLQTPAPNAETQRNEDKQGELNSLDPQATEIRRYEPQTPQNPCTEAHELQGTRGTWPDASQRPWHGRISLPGKTRSRVTSRQRPFLSCPLQFHSDESESEPGLQSIKELVEWVLLENGPAPLRFSAFSTQLHG
jgi:hypothetical protein